MEPRTPLKNLGMTFLHWLLFLASAGLGAYVQLAFSTDSGSSDGSGFLPVTIYDVHPVLYPLGTALTIAALVWGWRFLFRYDMQQSAEHSIGAQIAWWALWLLGCFAVFMGYLFIMLFAIGLFSSLEPDICEMYVIFYPVAVLLTGVIARIVLGVKRKNAAG